MIHHATMSLKQKGDFIHGYPRLTLLLATAREQNITRAAETLHIAQPSLRNS